MHQKEDSLLANFFQAQCEDPTKGDWVSQVKEDMRNLKIEMTFDNIKTFSKDGFKQTVKKHVKAAAFAGLKEIQETHNKSKKLVYNELKMQEYLSSNSGMTIKEKAFAFSARAQMLKVKCNFKTGNPNIKCSLGCDSYEDQEHILNCPVLEDDNLTTISNYSDLFGNNQMKIKMITQALMKKFAKFTNLKSTTMVHGQSQTKPSAADSAEDIVNDVDDNVNVIDCSDLELELE